MAARTRVGHRASGRLPGMNDGVFDLEGAEPKGPVQTDKGGVPELGATFYTASALTRGTLVYMSGRTVYGPTGSMPYATVSAAVVGTNGARWVVLEDTAAGALGTMVKAAIITPSTAFDTSGSTIGAAVYLSTSGGAPTLNATGQQVGFVQTVSTTGAVAYSLWAASNANSGTMAANDGTAALPGYAFAGTGGLNDGFYRPANDVVAIALGGAAALAFAKSSPTYTAATDTVGQDVFIVAAAAGGTATTAKAGAAISIVSGNGSTGTGTVAGGAGGNYTEAAGAGGPKTDTGAAAGGAGGSFNSRGGAGAATASAGTDAGGNGGSITDTGGAGGAATAGTGVGGNGGNCGNVGGAGGASFGGAGGSGGSAFLTGGAAGSSGAGGANGGNVALVPGAGSGTGFAGIARVGGAAPMPFVTNVAISTLADSDATVTQTDVRNGIWTVATGATNRTKTLPTAAQVVAAFPGIQVGNRIDIYVNNLKAANTATIAVGANITAVVGSNLVVAAQASAQFSLIATNVGSGTEAFTLLRTAG